MICPSPKWMRRGLFNLSDIKREVLSMLSIRGRTSTVTVVLLPSGSRLYNREILPPAGGYDFVLADLHHHMLADRYSRVCSSSSSDSSLFISERVFPGMINWAVPSAETFSRRRARRNPSTETTRSSPASNWNRVPVCTGLESLVEMANRVWSIILFKRCCGKLIDCSSCTTGISGNSSEGMPRIVKFRRAAFDLCQVFFIGANRNRIAVHPAHHVDKKLGGKNNLSFFFT